MTRTNFITANLAKVRNKALSVLEERLIDLAQRVDELNKKIDANEHQLRRIENALHQSSKYDATGLMPVSEHVIAAKIFNDLIMYLDPRDVAVVPHIVLERIWEREITKAWLMVLDKPDSTVFDIGANFGYFGMLASQRLGKKTGKVVMFEANPNLIPYIEKTLSVNWLHENTVVESIGVSDSAGKARLNVLKDYVGSSSMNSVEQLQSYMSDKMHVEAETVVEVPLITIDEYCKRNKINRIDFIKMDIEGYEDKAYKGMKSMIKKSPDMVLFIEFTKDAYQKPENFYDQILKDFINVYTIGPDGELLIPKDNSYKALVSPADVLIFLVFSKQPLSYAVAHNRKTE